MGKPSETSEPQPNAAYHRLKKEGGDLIIRAHREDQVGMIVVRHPESGSVAVSACGDVEQLSKLLVHAVIHVAKHLPTLELRALFGEELSRASFHAGELSLSVANVADLG